MAIVEHVFVLMLENRSFDHFFGLSGRTGIPRPLDPGFLPGATDRAPIDPPHEFDDVQRQLAGHFEASAKLAFVPSQIPVITQLADEFVLFDNWFAAVPGPTWPNRFFAHAATSGGLSTSPDQLQTAGAVIRPGGAFNFSAGATIFERVAQAGRSWRVYHGDVQPQVLALPGMVSKYIGGSRNFCQTYPINDHFSSFAADVADPAYAPAYTFIEPNYAVQIGGLFKFGDSQHPLGRVSAGESLIKDIYEALRSSPLWSTSVLLVVWDEHGGFYDHVAPPAAASPVDQPSNRPPNGDPGFQFDRFGVRVPALLISPLAPKGRLGSELFPGMVFDHTSIIKSVFENFGLGAPLTARDAAAPSWNACLDAHARDGLGEAPISLAAVVPDAVAPPAPPASSADVDGFLSGRMLIAHELDGAIAQTSSAAPIAETRPQSPADYEAARAASLQDPHFKLRVAQYVQEVDARAQAHRTKTVLGGG